MLAAKREKGAAYYSDRTIREIPIPLKTSGCEKKFYHGSMLIPGKVVKYGFEPIRLLHSTDTKNKKKLLSPLESSIVTGYRDASRGVYKSRDVQFPYIHMIEGYFYGCGDIRQVRSLLKGLRGIGKKVGLGYGSIKKIDVVPVEEDNSIFVRGKLVRIVPAAEMYIPDAQIEMVSYRPPYWDPQNQAICYVPAEHIWRVRRNNFGRQNETAQKED
jgi:hypothetical protein